MSLNRLMSWVSPETEQRERDDTKWYTRYWHVRHLLPHIYQEPGNVIYLIRGKTNPRLFRVSWEDFKSMIEQAEKGVTVTFEESA